MFGGGGSDDPFRNPFGHIHRQMRQMDNMMNAMLGDAFDMLNSFGMPRNPMITEDDPRFLPSHRRPRINDDMMMSPFGGFGFGGPLFGGMMQQMHNIQDRAMDDPNSVVFSQSTMVSYDGNGQPKVVQSSTRKAGDVKETRRALRDGDKDEVSVGHSIGNKTHLVEKKRDKDGRVRQQQKFINLDEDEAEDFNRQFKSKARENLSSLGGLFGGRDYRNAAIENGKYGGGSRGRNSYHRTGGESSSTPIITIPDDDEDEEQNRRSGSGPYGRNGKDQDILYSNNGIGPTIQEIDEDEAESTNPKRRKGLFGKFHS